MAAYPPSQSERNFFRTITDSLPIPVFVVDDDVRIIRFNQSASGLLSDNPKACLNRRGGEVLHCINSMEVPEGCGHAEPCRNCVIRTSVTRSFEGQSIVRNKTRMELVQNGKVAEVFIMVTTSPFTFGEKKFVLLCVEDITELIQFKNMIPICANCKKIREDNIYWTAAEDFFKKHLDLNFTHALCPHCVKSLYPELDIDTEIAGRN